MAICGEYLYVLLHLHCFLKVIAMLKLMLWQLILRLKLYNSNALSEEL